MTGRAHIGLLRGVNVSGAGKLPSALLAEIASSRLKLEAVTTYIQSGNLVFRADDVEGLDERLANEIEVACGFRPAAFIRSHETWRLLIEGNPFAASARTEPKSVHLYLLGSEPSPEAAAALSSRDFGSDEWRMAERAIYLHLPDGAGRSKLVASIECLLKVPMTGRNWSTVLALDELCARIAV